MVTSMYTTYPLPEFDEIYFGDVDRDVNVLAMLGSYLKEVRQWYFKQYFRKDDNLSASLKEMLADIPDSSNIVAKLRPRVSKWENGSEYTQLKYVCFLVKWILEHCDIDPRSERDIQLKAISEVNKFIIQLNSLKERESDQDHKLGQWRDLCTKADEFAKLKKTQQEKLKENYLEYLREHFGGMDFGSLPPGLAGPTLGILLSTMYVPLQLTEEDDSVNSGDGSFTPKKIEDKPKQSIENDNRHSSAPEAKDEISPSLKEEYRLKSVSSRLIDIWQAIENSSNRLIITGGAGAGKTTLLKYIVSYLADETGTTISPRLNERLPVYVSLADYALQVASNEGLQLDEFICHQSLRSDYQELIRQELTRGNCLLLFDEVDVVANLSKIERRIKAFCNAYAHNVTIIACREQIYPQLTLGGKFQRAQLSPFTLKQIYRYIDNWYNWKVSQGRDDPSRLHQEQQRLKQEFEQEQLQILAKDPLVLAIIVLQYSNSRFLPKSKRDLYENVITALLDLRPQDQGRAELKYIPHRLPRDLMEEVAYQMVTNRGRIAEAQVIELLIEQILEREPWQAAKARDKAYEWLPLLIKHTGLLTEKFETNGSRTYSYALHQQFFEYLAACSLDKLWKRQNYDFVLDHAHQTLWRDTFTLFVAIQGKEDASDLLERLLQRESPWESIVHRDLLLVGYCIGLGTELSVRKGKLIQEVLKQLINLLVDEFSSGDLRYVTVEVLSEWKDTRYREYVIDQLLALLQESYPWYIRFYLARLLSQLGELKQSFRTLIDLRDTAIRWGDSKSAKIITETFLAKREWQTYIVEWFIEIAGKYRGQGIGLHINLKPTQTILITSQDRIFEPIDISRLEPEYQRKLYSGLKSVLSNTEEQYKAHWLDLLTSESTETIGNRVQEYILANHEPYSQFLAAQWLYHNYDKEFAIAVFDELVARSALSLEIVEVLHNLELRDQAIIALKSIAIQKVDYNPIEYTRLLLELGQEEESILWLLYLLVNPLIDKNSSESIEFRIFRLLTNTSARDVGLVGLLSIICNCFHPWRYSAAIVLLENGVDFAEIYDVILDIILRPGSSNQAEALVLLKKYVPQTEKTKDFLESLAAQIVFFSDTQYDSLSKLLQAGIVPTERLSEDIGSYDLAKRAEHWQQRKNTFKQRCNKLILNWLESVAVVKQNRELDVFKAFIYSQLDGSPLNSSADTIASLLDYSVISLRSLKNLGIFLITIKDMTTGRSFLERYVHQHSESTKAWLEIAINLLSLGHQELAKDFFAQGFKFYDSFKHGSYVLLYWLLLGENDKAKQELHKNIDTIIPNIFLWYSNLRQLPHNRLQVSLSIFIDSIEKYIPQSSYITHLLGIVQYQSQQTETALHTLKNLITIDPEYSEARYAYAQMLNLHGQCEDAQDELHQAQLCDPRHSASWVLEADICCNVISIERAQEAIKMALKLNPSDSQSWFIKAKVSEFEGRRLEAIQSLDCSLRLKPFDTDLMAYKAELLRRNEQYEHAYQVIKQVDKLEYKSITAWMTKTKILLSLDEEEQALTQLLSELHENDSQIRYCALTAMRLLTDSRAVDELLVVANNEDIEFKARIAALDSLAVMQSAASVPPLLSLFSKLKDNDLRLICARTLSYCVAAINHTQLVEAILGEDNINIQFKLIQGLAHIDDDRIISFLKDGLQSGSREQALAAANLLTRTPLELFEEYLRVDLTSQQSSEIQCLLAQAYCDLGLYNKAKLALANIGPSNFQDSFGRLNFYTVLSRIEQGLYKMDDAINYLRKVIMLDPNVPVGWIRLAQIFLEQDQPSKGMKHCWRAEDIDKAGWHLDVTDARLAICLWANGHKPEAIRVWKREATRSTFIDVFSNINGLIHQNGWGDKMVAYKEEISHALVNS